MFPTSAGLVFSHIITPALGNPCDSVKDQISNISAKLGCANPGQGIEPSHTQGPCYVFWLKIKGAWYYREVEAFNGQILKVGKKTKL